MHARFDVAHRVPWKKRRYVVANRTDAAIYAENAEGGLSFLKRFRNPRGRRHESALVAEPHFLGLLRSELSGPIRKIVLAEVPREFVHLSDREISAELARSLEAKK